MPRSRAIATLDIIIAVLVATGLVVWLTGGFYTQPFGVRVSMRTPDRTFMLAILLALVRWRMTAGRGRGFLRVSMDRYRRLWAAIFQPDADDVPDRLRSPIRWQLALAALGLAAIGAVMLHEQLAHMHSVADLGDPMFSIWRMGWVHQQLAGDPRPLFDANIFHPTRLALTLSDSMLLPSFAASPLLSAGIAPVVAYNVLMLSGILLSGLAAFLLAWRLTGSAQAAFVGGVLYAFYPYRWEHYSHLELQMTQWMPLALWFLHRFATTLRAREAIAAGLCVVAQLYSSMYYAVFFVFYAAAVLGAVFAVSKPGWKRVLGPLAVAGVVALVLAVPLARPYMAAQSMKGQRDPWAVDVYSAELSDYFRPHPKLALYRGRLLPANREERSLFPGLSPLALAAVGLMPPLGPIRLAYSAGMVLAFDMSRGMKGVLYPYLYDWLPGMRGMRVPARFAVILGISLIVIGAFGVRRLLRRFKGPRARGLVTGVVVLLAMVDLRPALGLEPLWPEPPSIYAGLAGRTDVVLAEFPFEGSVAVVNELPFMYFSVWHGLPMVDGYSGFTPPDHEQLVEDMRDFPGEASLAVLRGRGVTHVTANCAFMPERCAAFLARADASPSLKLIASDQWQGQPVRLYELRR